jgi:hypothetical protein
MSKIFHPLRRAILAALATGPIAAAAADTPPKPSQPDRKDAAEKVQEGNVQQWIEYYQRTRPQAPPVAPPTTPPATGKPEPPPAR